MKDSSLLRQIRHEQIMQLFASTPLSSIVSLINGAIVYFVLKDIAPTGYSRVWFGALIFVTFLRLLLYFVYRKAALNKYPVLLWHRLLAISSFAPGCVWGLLSLWLFPVDSVLHQAFIAFVIAGMTAAAVTTLSAYWLNATLFIVPALLPLIIRFLQIDNTISEAMGTMVALYTLILLASIHRTYKNILQNISLRLDASQRDQELSQFKSTLDRTLDCVFMFTPDKLEFFYANQGALGQIGYTYDELYKMHPYDIKPAFNQEQFFAIVKPLMISENPAVTFETLHQHKDGHTIPVEIFLQYINPKNEQARFVAIVRDITERKRLDRIKDEFVSTVSHELRTPLTSLRGSLGLISGGAVGEVTDKQRSLLTIAQQNTERLLVLINDILDIQKIESGNLDFHFAETDLIELIKISISENQAYADKYHVHFKFVPPEIKCVINIDADRISQVMSNLLSNAAKFSRPDTAVEICIEAGDGIRRVTVQDYGSGIAPEFQSKVFDKFTQSDATDQRVHGGTGLGLAISKSIIERHHGQIGFHSRIGVGTSFYFELPIMDEKTIL